MAKQLRVLLGLFLLILSPSQPLFAQTGDRDSGNKRDSDGKDMDALRRWLQDKRLVTMREIGGDLSLSGEVRTEFQGASEKVNGVELFGKDGPKSMCAWDVEFNLMLDYHTERTWAAIKLEYDNDMGQRSGTTNKIRLEKAYLGGRFVDGDTFTMDGEIGRRFLFNVFDSKIEFGSLFDGALLRFSKAFPTIADGYVKLASLIINDKSNHYAFVGEIGALRIANIGLNLSYTLIDWQGVGGEAEAKNTKIETELTNLRYRFLVSQILSSYQFYPQWMGKKLVKFYGAVLTNHLALKDPLARVGVPGQAFGKQNWGWYVGTSLGTVKKRNDWALDAYVQWVQAQAIPSFDNNGIGRGNAEQVGLYTKKADGSGGPNTKALATGNTNYYGFQVNGLYALTDTLTLNPVMQCSWTLDKNIGPDIVYKQCELEVIYAF